MRAKPATKSIVVNYNYQKGATVCTSISPKTIYRCSQCSEAFKHAPLLLLMIHVSLKRKGISWRSANTCKRLRIFLFRRVSPDADAVNNTSRLSANKIKFIIWFQRRFSTNNFNWVIFNSYSARTIIPTSAPQFGLLFSLI